LKTVSRCVRTGVFGSTVLVDPELKINMHHLLGNAIPAEHVHNPLSNSYEILFSYRNVALSSSNLRNVRFLVKI